MAERDTRTMPPPDRIDDVIDTVAGRFVQTTERTVTVHTFDCPDCDRTLERPTRREAVFDGIDHIRREHD